MKKQNYISAFIILFLSITCLLTGYWLADQERKELAEALLEVIEGNQRSNDLNTKTYIGMLTSLKQGDYIQVDKLLLSKAKSGLKHPSASNAKLRLQGLEYQDKFCDDRCLGL